MKTKYDAIVIGAGHNGLVHATRLAQAGLSTLVLEQSDQIGGCTRTVEMADCKVSQLSYVNSLFPPKIINELDLTRHGLRMVDRDPIVSFTPQKDGRHLALWLDDNKNYDAIKQFSEKDAEHYSEYEKQLTRIAEPLEELLFTTPPVKKFRSIPNAIKSLGILKKLRPEDIPVMLSLFTKDSYSFVRGHFESEPLIGTLCTDGTIGARGGPWQPGTAYVQLHHVMGEVEDEQGVFHRGRWAYVEGGMGGLAEALASSAKESGVDIKTNFDVNEIVSRNGKVIGVMGTENRSREFFESSLISSSADPNITFNKLLYRKFPTNFQTAIDSIDYGAATSKVNLVIDGLPKFHNYDGPTPAGTIHLFENSMYMEECAHESLKGNLSKDLMLEMCIPSTVDKTLVPEGSDKHVVSILVQYTPYRLAQGDWDSRRDELQEKVMDKLGEYCDIPNRVIASETITPRDLEKRFKLTGGNLFHGNFGPENLFVTRPAIGYADYRTPVEGLYLCGSGAHPGGGVTGIPGYNSAREVLKDKGIKVK